MELTGDAPSLTKPNVLATRWQGQWIGIIGIGCLLTFSWIPNSYYVMVSWPWILLWQIAFLLLGAWNIWMIRQFSVPFHLLGYGLDWAVGAVLIVTTISALGAEFREIALWNTLLLGNYAITLYLLVNWLRQGLLPNKLWFALSFSGVVTSTIGLFLWKPTTDMWLSNDFLTALRNPWPLGHHNFVGGYALLLLPVTMGFSLSQQGWKKWMSISLTSIIAISLYVSGSRGAMIGALAVILIGIPVLLWMHRVQTNRRWIMSATIGLAIVLSIVASNPRMRDLFEFTTSSQVNQTASVVISDGPAQDRLFMLQAAKDIFSTHPMLGVGPGNLSRVYNLYRPIEVGNGLELVQQLHNTPAQILAELGILGLVTYGGWLIGLIKLGKKIYCKLSTPADRFLFYGISASYLGYGVSSLTDYQLENIGISSTLLIITALLINLGDSYVPSSSTDSPAKVSHQSRRWLSLGILSFLCLSSQLWAVGDAGLYLSNAAFKDMDANELVKADSKLAKASNLAKWDPTYSLLAAEQIISLKPGAESPSDKAALNQTAIEYLESAFQAAPNDTWLNQNMAVLLLENNEPEKAEIYAQRASLLSPRNTNYTYYTLGISYLQQNKIEQAITAFSLEGAANPYFLIADLWADERFSFLLPSVLDKTLEIDRQILSKTNPDSVNYQWMNDQFTMLSWWYQEPLERENESKTSPLVKAILNIEDRPETALKIVDQQLKERKDNPGLQLLQAWLLPEKHLDNYLQDFKGTQQEKELLTKHISQTRDIRTWMNSVLTTRKILRNGVSFAYRNMSANNIKQILYPGEIRTSLFTRFLGLFGEAPRIFPQLDQAIAATKKTDLLLPPLSETRFQLPKTSVIHIEK